jgi:hypothetical protein
MLDQYGSELPYKKTKMIPKRKTEQTRYKERKTRKEGDNKIKLNKIGKVYTLEYTEIRKVFFTR